MKKSNDFMLFLHITYVKRILVRVFKCLSEIKVNSGAIN